MTDNWYDAYPSAKSTDSASSASSPTEAASNWYDAYPAASEASSATKPQPMSPQEAALRRGERPSYLGPSQNDSDMPWWLGQDTKFGRLTHLAEDQLGLRDELVGLGQGTKALAKTGSWDEASKAYNDAAEYARAEKRIAREKEGWVGTAAELTGGLATVGPGKSIMRNATGELIPAVRDAAAPAQRVPFFRQDPNLIPRATAPAEAAPGFLRRVGTNAAAGATFGAEKGFAEGEGGFGERAENAAKDSLTGLIAGPIIGEAIPATLGLGNNIARYAGRNLHEGLNPQLGSDRAITRTMEEAGITPQEIIDQVVPGISAQLGRRAYTQPEVEALVARASNPTN